MRVAVYPSVLYGSDFIKESIESILPHVDLVYVVLMTRPWGNTKGVIYQDKWVAWPDKFDNTREKIAELNQPRLVRTIETYKESPWNRWGFAVAIVRELCTPTEILLIDPDCVFTTNNIEQVIANWQAHADYQWASVEQVELWRTPAWQIDRARQMVSLHRGDLNLLVSNTAETRPKSHLLQGRVHNLGFCCSPQNTLWKHLASMAFSPVIGESIPNPRWYEEKWLNWEPGVRDLEPSLRCESAISHAFPYDIDGLPASIKKRYDAGEWPLWERVS